MLLLRSFELKARSHLFHLIHSVLAGTEAAEASTYPMNMQNKGMMRGVASLCLCFVKLQWI